MFPTLQLPALSIAGPSGRLLPDLYGENGAVRLRPPAETSAQQRYDGHDGLFAKKNYPLRRCDRQIAVKRERIYYTKVST
jgi:hypothetical protein